MAWTRGYQRGAGNGLQGLDDLRATMGMLKDKTAQKAAKAGVNAGLKIIADAVKREINGLPISGELKAAARATVNKRLRKKEGQDSTGKVGFGVGAKTAKKKETAHARYLRGQGGGHETRGVGVSASNIHWFVLGTEDRSTGMQTVGTYQGRRVRRFSGHAFHHTGRISSMTFAGVIERAVESATPDVLSAMVERVNQVLAGDIGRARR
jgi:hypothetical protein